MRADERLYAFGWALGTGGTTFYFNPTLIKSGVSRFFLYDYDTGFVLTSSNTLEVTGEGDYGPTGLGNDQDLTDQDVTLDIAGKTCNQLNAGYNSTLALMTDGTLYGFGRNNDLEAARTAGQKLSPVLETKSFNDLLRAVRIGQGHSLILTSTGSLSYKSNNLAAVDL